MFQKFVTSPYLNLAVGITLIVTGMFEAFNGMEEVSESVGAHHGVVVFGVVHALKALVDTFEGSKMVDETKVSTR